MIFLLQRTILDSLLSLLYPLKRISLLARDLREKRDRSEVYFVELRLSRASSLFRAIQTGDADRLLGLL